MSGGSLVNSRHTPLPTPTGGQDFVELTMSVVVAETQGCLSPQDSRSSGAASLGAEASLGVRAVFQESPGGDIPARGEDPWASLA